MIVFVLSLCVVDFVVFKQKAAYEMRISDWSSDVCPSDLSLHPHHLEECLPDRLRGGARTQDLAGTLDEVRVDHQGGLLRCHAIYLLCHVAVDSSEERGVGNAGVSRVRSRGLPYNQKKTIKIK